MSEYPAYFALGWFLLQEFDPVGGGVEVAGGGGGEGNWGSGFRSDSEG